MFGTRLRWRTHDTTQTASLANLAAWLAVTLQRVRWIRGPPAISRNVYSFRSPLGRADRVRISQQKRIASG